MRAAVKSSRRTRPHFCGAFRKLSLAKRPLLCQSAPSLCVGPACVGQLWRLQMSVSLAALPHSGRSSSRLPVCGGAAAFSPLSVCFAKMVIFGGPTRQFT